MLNKQEQIEIIVDESKKLFQTVNKVNKVFKADCEIFDSFYNIGFRVIPAILGIDVIKDEEADDELGDLFTKYLWGEINKEEYFNKIEKYTKKEPNHD